jgi:KEOPS complex subunit Cgi121
MRAVEEGSALSILGFRSAVVGNVNDFLKRVKAGVYPAAIQMMDAKRIAGKAHLLFAFLNAQKSFDQERAVSENIEMETLLYASGQRQITKAIEMLGVNPQTSDVAAIIFAPNENEIEEAEEKLEKLIHGVRDDRVLCVKRRNKVEDLMKTFGVTELELKTMAESGTSVEEALTWLIVERVSILAVRH